MELHINSQKVAEERWYILDAPAASRIIVTEILLTVSLTDGLMTWIFLIDSFVTAICYDNNNNNTALA